MIDSSSRILLREPFGHYGGYVWSFPKGHAEPGETDEEAVLREVRKETGVVARIVARIPGLPRRHHAERVPLDAPDRRGKPARSRNRQRSVCYAR